MTEPERDKTPRERAADAVRSGRPEQAQAWALLSIADDLAHIRRAMEHATRRAVRGG